MAVEFYTKDQFENDAEVVGEVRRINKENLLANGGMLRDPEFTGEEIQLIARDDESGATLGYTAVSPAKNELIATRNETDHIAQLGEIGQLIEFGYYIHQTAVDRRFQHRGVGSDMYQHLIDMCGVPIMPGIHDMWKLELDTVRRFHKSAELAEVPLFAHVSIRNIPSMRFHLKHGFLPIGTFHRDDFHGETDYNSVLLVHCAKSDLR